MAVRPIDGLAAVGADAWDTLVPPGRGPLRHGYLRAWGHAELDNLLCRPLVACGSDPERLLAAAPAYLYDLDLAFVQRQVMPRFVGTVRRAFPRFLVARMYELGCAATWADPLLRHPSLDDRAAAEALLRAALMDADRNGAKLVIAQDYVSREGPVADAFRACGFQAVPIAPTVVLELPYDSFEDYLGAMRSSYRRRARKALARTEGLRVQRIRRFAPLAGELARLWRLVYDRADEVKREALPEPFFSDAAALEETSVLLLRRPDGSIASFALLFDDEPWLHFLYCGFEERAGREEGAYFRLLYEIVRVGIEGGFERVDLGITTVEPKLDVGGVPVPLYAWFRHRSAPMSRVFAAIQRGPLAPEVPAPRRVFRDPVPAAPPVAAALS